MLKSRDLLVALFSVVATLGIVGATAQTPVMGNAGLMLFSLLIGALVKTIGYTPFFVCLSVLDLIGAVVLWTVLRRPEEDRLQAS